MTQPVDPPPPQNKVRGRDGGWTSACVHEAVFQGHLASTAAVGATENEFDFVVEGQGASRIWDWVPPWVGWCSRREEGTARPLGVLWGFHKDTEGQKMHAITSEGGLQRKTPEGEWVVMDDRIAGMVELGKAPEEGSPNNRLQRRSLPTGMTGVLLFPTELGSSWRRA